ncbi:tctex1 domain-containing protein 4-like [Octopus sinensis]|uniref:Tctex1 domain-containing protein 4-like n=1 Tax=Octopus sinensis TaxID=2607531 RepID=A0A7E6F2C2_9MOLL|nr:tctex1 domain-containing protein 4-like [Octopus sinensis]
MDLIRRMTSRYTSFHDTKQKSQAFKVSVFSVKPEPQENEPKPQYDPQHPMHAEFPFIPDRARVIIKDCLRGNLEGTLYDENTAKKKAILMSNTIKNEVKQLNFSRYKYVCTVLIGEKKRQDLALSRKVLQSSEDDGYAEYVYENGSLVAHGVIVAFYCE